MKDGLYFETGLSREQVLGLANNAIQAAKEFAPEMGESAAAFDMARSYLRAAAEYLNKIDGNLAELGTSTAELKKIIAPPHLKMTNEEIEDLWGRVWEHSQSNIPPVAPLKD